MMTRFCPMNSAPATCFAGSPSCAQTRALSLPVSDTAIAAVSVFLSVRLAAVLGLLRITVRIPTGSDTRRTSRIRTEIR